MEVFVFFPFYLEVFSRNTVNGLRFIQYCIYIVGGDFAFLAAMPLVATMLVWGT